MIKDYIPFIIFASIIAICTIIFIIKGNMTDDDTEEEQTTEDGEINQESQDR
jgi:hypothetical protein